MPVLQAPRLLSIAHHAQTVLPRLRAHFHRSSAACNTSVVVSRTFVAGVVPTLSSQVLGQHRAISGALQCYNNTLETITRAFTCQKSGKQVEMQTP